MLRPHRLSDCCTALVFAALLVAAKAAPALPQTRQAGTAAAAPASATFTAEDALEVNTATIGDLTDDGRYLAVISTMRRDQFGQDFRRDGDPTYARGVPVRLLVIDTKTGAIQSVFPDKQSVRNVRWSPDGKRLGMLVFNGDVSEPVVWDRTTAKLTRAHLPAGKYVAENSDLRWTPDGKQLVFALHTMEWRKKARDTFANMTAGPVFVQSSLDPFLAWDDVRRMANVRSVVAFDPQTNQVRELIPEVMVSNYTLAEDGSAISFNRDVQRKTDYDSFGSETSLHTRTSGGAEKTLLASTKGAQVQFAEDGRHYAYSKEGRVYVGSIDDAGGANGANGSNARLLAGPPETRRGETPDTTKAARDRAAKERFTLVRYSPAGDALLLSNREGLWLVDIASADREEVIATQDSSTTAPRIAFAAWSNDGRHIYLSKASRQRWERGFVRYDRPAKSLTELVKDGRSYSGLRLSKDGNTAVLSIANGNRPADIYVADANLANARRLVETNPQLNQKRIGPTELVSFLDADGHPKNAVVYYPADYQKGHAYPTVFEVYEDFFDDTYDVRANVLTGHGYVVVHPSVDFDIGYPGEAWLKGVTAAANKLIELGVADSARLAVQGQSYGGYAVNLLVTQTNRFKAAVNISGKVDLISFYTDSPRLGVRNVNAAEKTQDRIGATMWEQPQKYVAHSAVLFADRIKTPMLLITGEQDSNVPADNTREMYYALRRLGKEVVWVDYMNGGHGGGTATADDFLDMQRRILEWYDSKLKPATGKVASN
ncbi:MAG TPA: prolyl oligopeptidase family serine peptidase [Gemmatimonadaceae bacterium]|nr:prolyl oligopeptidase family serine peptidase [Gemmatimonadaceae bacterium]